MIKPVIFAACFAFGYGEATAQNACLATIAGTYAMPMRPGRWPDALPLTGRENETTVVTNSLVAGKPWIAVGNLSQPTMTLYSPKRTNTGAAVVSNYAMASTGGDLASHNWDASKLTVTKFRCVNVPPSSGALRSAARDFPVRHDAFRLSQRWNFDLAGALLYATLAPGQNHSGRIFEPLREALDAQQHGWMELVLTS